MIRRRSSQQKGKETGSDAPAPFFNFTDETPVEEGPLFNLEELHERRILSWSPEPEELFDEPQADAEPEPTRSEREELARSVYERPPAVEAPVVEERVEASAVAVAEPSAPPRIVAPAEKVRPRPVVAPTVEPVREIAPQPPVEAAVEDDEQATAPAEHAPKRRGRPRGRPRRQVHFHVDPDEERLLMAAVEKYGSQQKGLIAALESLQEAELLRDEIERLRAETARNRRLLDEAGALFNR